METPVKYEDPGNPIVTVQINGQFFPNALVDLGAKKDSRPIRQPQRRLNPHLKDIVKDELRKLLDVNFIYPISDSKWVSPLVVVAKKNRKWRICVDYRELNKTTQKDHFPLPFIDQLLDTLAGKKLFSFLDGFSGYNQIQIAPEDQDKTTLDRKSVV